MKKLLCLATGIALVFVSCGGGERASILAYIQVYEAGTDTIVKDFGIDMYKYNGFKEIPLVTLNDDTVHIPLDMYYVGVTSFDYNGEAPWLSTGAECRFKADYGEGSGEAKDTIPAEFQISSPDPGYILTQGSNLSIAWGSSNGAQWYWLYVDISYYYMDNSGGFDDFDLELDTIIEGTSFTLPASRLFPSDVDTVLYGSGYVDIEAYSGPKIVAGEEGNIKGSAVGFFWGIYAPDAVGFGIEAPANAPPDDQRQETFQKHLKVLSDYAAEN
ncbi:MAG TPA: hypothetical protein VF399_12625 [bacterium]